MKTHSSLLGLLSAGLVLACAPPDDEASFQGVGPIPGQSTGSSGDNAPQFDSPTFNLDGEPIYSRAVPLTNDQWARSVKSILRLDAEPTQAQSFLAPVGGFTTFSNNERVLEVSNNLRESYQYAAAEVAANLVEEGGILAAGAGTDAETFVRTMGRRAFRRPLTEIEVSAYKGLFDVGMTLSGDGTDFEKGAGLVIEGLLQSPNFLYRTELSPEGQPLSSFELAAKLSFWLLGTTPDDSLLDKAQNGDLDTAAGLLSVVDEMLEDPAVIEMTVDIFADLFKFSRYRDIIKSDPAFSTEMGKEAEVVSRRFFEWIFESGMGLREILTSTEGYVGPSLAELYGISPAPADVSLRDLGPSRVGFFSQIPYLMLFGDDTHSDAIHRGIFLNYEVLCAKLPTPTFQVPQLSAPLPNQTDRQRVEDHTGFDTCGEQCHGGYINPLGYAFENFDGLGRERSFDKGQPIDTVSAYPFADDAMTTFSGAPELMNLIASGETAHSCLVKNFMSYGLQRDIIESDRTLIDQLTSVSMSSSGSLKEILRQLATSPEFRTRSGAI